jgi:hypothetical protein
LDSGSHPSPSAFLLPTHRNHGAVIYLLTHRQSQKQEREGVGEEGRRKFTWRDTLEETSRTPRCDLTHTQAPEASPGSSQPRRGTTRLSSTS